MKIIIGLLLLINGIGALYGGVHLILHPDGSSIQMSLDWLKNTPFTDYLIPGVILFIANGLFSLFVLFHTIKQSESYPWLVIAQGVILTGWIVIQVILVDTIYFLHIIMGAIGLALILLGWLQIKINNSSILKTL